MTNELAIQELLTVASTLKQTSQGEAVMRGIVALEMQIPRKPVKEQCHMACPECGYIGIEEYSDNGLRQYPYCPCCGQAISWE